MKYIPENRLLKLRDIIGDPKATPPIPAIIPVCKASWYQGQKTGRYPKPVRIGDSRGTFYKAEEIFKLIASA